MHTISVTFQLTVEGFHRWPDAPPEHDYLRARHRHLFLVRGRFPVRHGQREVEFIALRRAVQTFLYDRFGIPCEFDALSCEQIALMVHKHFDLAACEVLEDGENGALVEKYFENP